MRGDLLTWKLLSVLGPYSGVQELKKSNLDEGRQKFEILFLQSHKYKRRFMFALSQ